MWVDGWKNGYPVAELSFGLLWVPSQGLNCSYSSLPSHLFNSVSKQILVTPLHGAHAHFNVLMPFAPPHSHISSHPRLPHMEPTLVSGPLQKLVLKPRTSFPQRSPEMVPLRSPSPRPLCSHSCFLHIMYY